MRWRWGPGGGTANQYGQGHHIYKARDETQRQQIRQEGKRNENKTKQTKREVVLSTGASTPDSNHRINEEKREKYEATKPKTRMPTTTKVHTRTDVSEKAANTSKEGGREQKKNTNHEQHRAISSV